MSQRPRRTLIAMVALEVDETGHYHARTCSVDRDLHTHGPNATLDGLLSNVARAIHEDRKASGSRSTGR